MVENTDPIVFYLYNAFNSEEVRQLLIDKFRSSGHCRRIDFIDWDCLNEKPPRGGDLYILDSVVLSHMCANSYIRKMPEIIDKEGIFQWALDTTKYKNANYGVPLMLCAGKASFLLYSVFCNPVDCLHLTDYAVYGEDRRIYEDPA